MCNRSSTSGLRFATSLCCAPFSLPHMLSSHPSRASKVWIKKCMLTVRKDDTLRSRAIVEGKGEGLSLLAISDWKAPHMKGHLMEIAITTTSIPADVLHVFLCVVQTQSALAYLFRGDTEPLMFSKSRIADPPSPSLPLHDYPTHKMRRDVGGVIRNDRAARDVVAILLCCNNPTVHGMWKHCV